LKTLKIELDDNIYKNITQSGVDIQAKVKEFLVSFVDDGFPAISKDEASKRINEAVDNHKNDSATYLDAQEYEDHMSKYMKSLQAKYDNN
jgi:hypothetical protein